MAVPEPADPGPTDTVRTLATSGGDPSSAIDRVFRTEFPRLVGGLTRLTGDVGVAQDLAQDALVAALEQWPGSGVPLVPGAWLMAIGKRRAVDLFRRSENLQRKYGQIGHTLMPAGEAAMTDSFEACIDNDIGDDLLRLLFTACHPVLSVPARVALTLRLLGGLTTDEIARAYLVPEPTIAQRIVRAKKTLTTAGVPFEVPRGRDFLDRLPTVLEVVYLIFNEGYSATSSDEWMRPELCAEALRLGRLIAGLVPREPEALGLLSLMEIQSSRTTARVGADGEPVLLLDQDRSSWDRTAIDRGLAALTGAQALGGRGSYVLQAEIAARHARPLRARDTDWIEIARLYGDLAAIVPTPVVELNRAVALSMAYGPQAGLALVDQLSEVPSLRAYHLLPSVRGDLLFKLGRFNEARAEFERAAALTRNIRERELSLARAQDCVLG